MARVNTRVHQTSGRTISTFRIRGLQWILRYLAHFSLRRRTRLVINFLRMVEGTVPTQNTDRHATRATGANKKVANNTCHFANFINILCRQRRWNLYTSIRRLFSLRQVIPQQACCQLTKVKHGHL